ncbi:phage portal protein [Rhodococcus pyridinivorans]|uniref:Phage portal protein n=1 Tax=Rhodococcus pyridinivorans TaxID=103816 RepID=A0A7M2XNW5_9NOCA|nr:phage portal protein [Rhodococcus pyridinivorans]QOV99518.1 phage portal protein [Rhodococcus pyridinivorans]
MVAFQTLGELSTYLDSRDAIIDVADPGIPLTDFGTSLVDEAAILRNQPSIRKVTGFIARHVSTVPLHVFQRLDDTDRQRVTDHDLALVMREPRPRVTAVRFWRDVMMDYLIHDRWCLVWNYERDGRLTLTRIPARRMKFKADGIGQIVEVRVTQADGTIVSIDPEQCILDVGYSTRSGANGISPIETLHDLLAESAEAVKYRRSVWQNGARIPQVVKRPAEAKPWGKDGRSRFLRGLEAFRKGGGKEGAWLLLEDGMELGEAASFRPRDTLDLDGRKLTDIEVANAYHVPPELIGAREGTYSNVEAFRQMLYGDVLGPWLVAIEQALNTQLVPQVSAPEDRLYVEYAVEAKMRGSFLEQAKVGQTVVGAPTFTRNEWRARMNLPRIDGGDELITPLNVLTGGQASPTDVEGRPEE